MSSLVLSCFVLSVITVITLFVSWKNLCLKSIYWMMWISNLSFSRIVEPITITAWSNEFRRFLSRCWIGIDTEILALVGCQAIQESPFFKHLRLHLLICRRHVAEKIQYDGQIVITWIEGFIPDNYQHVRSQIWNKKLKWNSTKHRITHWIFLTQIVQAMVRILRWFIVLHIYFCC